MDQEGAERETEELRKLFGGLRVPADGDSIPVSLSIGVASFPADAKSGAALLQMADMRMYDAKARKARAGSTMAAA
jgi:GGDEF domain-containing protein